MCCCHLARNVGTLPRMLSTSEQAPKMGVTKRKQRQAAWYQDCTKLPG